MNYKETLYFVAKCLTVSWENKNRQEIEKQLKSKSVNWGSVVKVSTAHYVFPALYCNLKRVNFLDYLPHKLVDYMKYLTDSNLERNKQIIAQAIELNRLLLDNHITPIFIKGTANLLAGVYENIAERMVGDIDFIFSKDDYPKAISILLKFGYVKVIKTDYNYPMFKHYPRLVKENEIAAIEIHKELLLEKYASEFNYKIVEKDSQVINGVKVLSFANKLNLSIISSQINDNNFYFKTITLRNAYDVFLLSKKTNAKRVMIAFDKLTNPVNCFLATCYEVFNKVDSLKYIKTKNTVLYLNVFKSQFNNSKKTTTRYKRIKKYLTLKYRINLIYKSFLHKDYRVYLYNRVTDKNWYKEKLIRLGIKNRKKSK